MVCGHEHIIYIRIGVCDVSVILYIHGPDTLDALLSPYAAAGLHQLATAEDIIHGLQV